MTTISAPDLIAAVRAHFGDACEELRVEGDEPLLLDDSKYCYLTQNAHHQLFCVGYRDGKAAGRREHVALLRPGQLLFALPPSPEQEEPAVLLLSGAAASIVLRLPTRLVIEALALADRPPLIARLFDAWIELLVSTLPSAPIPTRCDAVEAGLTLGPATVPLRAKDGVVWIALASPPSRYGGVRVSEHAAMAPRQWPLTESTWIVGGTAAAPYSMRAPSVVPASTVGEWAAGARTSRSADLVVRQRSASFADEFYGFVVSFLARQRDEIAKSRLERDVASRHAEGEFVGDALADLALVGRGERLATAELGEGDAFQQAAQRIAGWLEIPSLNVPWPPARERPNLGRIQTALSHLTAVRARKVLLEGDWFTHDSGAILGFVLDEGDEVNDDRLNPVALLPTALGYALHDARSEAPQTVTAELAERLHPQAYQFYASLPDRPLGPLDVLKFSSRRAYRDIAFVLLVGLGLSSLTTLIPLLTGYVFDSIIPGAERALLVQLTLVLALVYIGQGLFDLARGLMLVRGQTRMDATLEAGVWDRLLSLPLPFFREYSAGDLASRAAGIGGIRDLLAGTTLNALLGGIFSVWNFVFLFLIDPTLALVATGLVVVAVVPSVFMTRFGLKRQRIVAAIDGKICGLLLQLLTGIAKLRVTAAENRAFAVWARLFARRRDADIGTERVYVRIGVFQDVYPMICTMILYWMLAGTGKQKVTTGLFLAFSTAFGLFLGATMQVIDAVLHSLAAIPMYERARPILAARTESLGSGERVALKGGIEVNHASFRYAADGPLILDDVSFQIEPDEFVALVGPSGSGKSTLLRLLLGFESATEGGVYYDGHALAGLDVRAVRKQIGVVMQNSRVMGGDIYTNIVGSTGLTQEDAWNAARNAALDKDIEAMPMGMHTVIAQGGGTLSGGQRQRLLIARALAADPRVVFFDEATSALDNVTQATVSESLESLRVTRVVIAHRLSTIRHADKIIVLEKGRVVQMGRYEELVDVDGPFQRLAKRQLV
ncbi:MAG TPA: NHLP bacteriocin export ABC transporter permease/ATPase subunit [Labilithrix sp.]|nr:NHLP bacteriocin export ABC transporter permease/ATPase subunit [Labilithrix sp.]